MSALGRALFLTVLDIDGTTERAKWQNFWPGQFVDGHTFVPFSCSAMSSNSLGLQDTLSVTMPAIPVALDLTQAGISSAWLVRVQSYQFVMRDNSTTPPSAKTLIGEFLGEILKASLTISGITMELGSALSPTGIYVPPRTFTSTLVGNPPKL